MPKPKTDQDDTTEAVKPPAPAKTEMVEIEFRGEKFYVPKDRDDWDTEAFIAIANGDPYVSLQIVLGPEQWLKLRRIGTERRVAKEFSKLFGEIAAKECIN